MNDTASWVVGQPTKQVAEKPSAAGRRALILAAFILVAGLCASTWMYFQETQLSRFAGRAGAGPGASAADANFLLQQQFDRWALWVVSGTAVGGTGFLLAAILGLSHWRGAMTRRFTKMEEGWRKTASSLHLQLSDCRKNEEQLKKSLAAAEEKMASLVYGNTQLRSEMDTLRKTEKTLSQQRQSLESSKTVLELHVQARTKELQKLQRRYEMILNSAGEGICGLDPDGRATFVNPAVARITGWPIAELIGKTEQEIFGSNGANGHEAPKSQNPGEQVFYRKDGSCFPVECVKTPINENDCVVGSVLVFKDITERKRVEETMTQKAAELARSNSELEQFAFVASHDLQEPLRKIQAFGDRLKTKCEGAIAADAQDYLERMQSASARMRTLINDLLAFSRVIRSSEPFVEVDLGQVTREVMGDLEVRIEKTGAKVEVGELPTIEADAMQMRQLLLNLLGNALKFQPAGAQPLVKISSRIFSANSGEKICEISIKDNGIGFDEKYMDKIFAVFQRLHGRNEYEGTGVGLAVCRRITDRHHGNITAKSQLGQGATFIVTLPMRQPKPDEIK